MSVVEIRGVAKTFRTPFRRTAVQALRGVELEIGQGEILGLVGPNGAGKSTLLLGIAGMLSMDAGEIRVAGTVVRRGGTGVVGFASEGSAYHRTETVVQTLTCLARIRGLNGQAARATALAVLEQVALTPYADRRVSSLSHGMVQRLGVAQAWIGNPVVVLLDETLSGVDPVVHREICDDIRALAARGTTVVLSSHDLFAVEELSTRVVVLAEGRVRGSLQAAELGQRGVLREKFFELLGSATQRDRGSERPAS